MVEEENRGNAADDPTDAPRMRTIRGASGVEGGNIFVSNPDALSFMTFGGTMRRRILVPGMGMEEEYLAKEDAADLSENQRTLDSRDQTTSNKPKPHRGFSLKSALGRLRSG